MLASPCLPSASVPSDRLHHPVARSPWVPATRGLHHGLRTVESAAPCTTPWDLVQLVPPQVRQLEKRWALQLQEGSDVGAVVKRLRPLDSYDIPYLVRAAGGPSWWSGLVLYGLFPSCLRGPHTHGWFTVLGAQLMQPVRKGMQHECVCVCTHTHLSTRYMHVHAHTPPVDSATAAKHTPLAAHTFHCYPICQVVDTGSSPWSILHMNIPAVETLGKQIELFTIQAHACTAHMLSALISVGSSAKYNTPVLQLIGNLRCPAHELPTPHAVPRPTPYPCPTSAPRNRRGVDGIVQRPALGIREAPNEEVRGARAAGPL